MGSGVHEVRCSRGHMMDISLSPVKLHSTRMQFKHDICPETLKLNTTNSESIFF